MMAPMASGKRSLYEILGIERDANNIDIGLAYERRRDALAKAASDASETALVQQAYEVLSNPKRRAAYDASLVTAEEKAAAASQATTDLVLEPEEAPAPRKMIWAGVGAGLVVIAAAAYFTWRSERAPAPPKAAAVEAPKPVVPEPPKPVPAATILASATTSVGQVLSYDMGGQAKPLGLAIAIDRGVFLTTCHGISAGSALVVRIGLESHSGSLALADEELDLCRIAVPDLRGAGLATGDEAKAGDRIYVMGANAKGEMALTEGNVKQLRATPMGNVLEISVPIAPNASGGPVFDTYGRLVGIATTPHAFGANLSIALPAAWSAQMRTRVKPAR
jgi:S1-C subfamily serine protease